MQGLISIAHKKTACLYRHRGVLLRNGVNICRRSHVPAYSGLRVMEFASETKTLAGEILEQHESAACRWQA